MLRRTGLLSLLAASAFLVGCGAAGKSGREARAPLSDSSLCAANGPASADPGNPQPVSRYKALR